MQIILNISWFCFLDGLDGLDFSRYNNYYCKSSYKTVTGVVAATTKCREDIKCAMISSLACNTEDSEYTLCEKSTELLPKLESCTLWKKGKNIWIEMTKSSLYMFVINHFDQNPYYLKLNLHFKKNVIVRHCSDGKKNEDETQQDCGGSCKPCQGMSFWLSSSYIFLLKYIYILWYKCKI